MARLLDAPLELAASSLIEEQHGLAHREPVLDPAEAQHVDAGPPGQIGRRAAELRQRIGEAGAVHVHFEAMAARRLGQRRDLVRRVNGAELGRLGERQSARLDVVHAATLHGEPVDGVGCQLGERRSAATILAPPLRAVPGAPASSSSMWLSAMGDDGMVGPAQLRQRQRVGRRAVEDEKHLAIRLEQLAYAVAGLRGPGIVAVAGRRAPPRWPGSAPRGLRGRCRHCCPRRTVAPCGLQLSPRLKQ